MKANASKHKAMSYGRMLEEEKRLEAEVERLLEEAEEAEPRGRIPMGLSVADRMRRKLRAKRGRAVYARRKGIVEPVFGQIKRGRGFRQFLLRGITKVRAEWALICMGHNMLKPWRAAATGPPMPAAAVA